MNDGTSNKALRNAIIVGTAVQLAMVVSGHWVAFIKMNLCAGNLQFGNRRRCGRGDQRGTALMRVSKVLAAAIVAATLCVPIRSGAQASAAPATAVDFAWLAGTWEGHMPGAAMVAEATYNAPKAGIVTGMMRITDKGRVVMIEFITLTDSPSGVELRFRHFNGHLDALEPVFKQNFQLVKHSGDRDEFENVVPFDKALASTEARNAIYTRHGQDEFVGHSDIIDEKGKPDVIELTWKRIATPPEAPTPAQPARRAPPE